MSFKDRIGEKLGPLLEQVRQLLTTSIINFVKLIFWASNILVLLVILFTRILGNTLRTLMNIVPRFVKKVMPKKTKLDINQQIVYAGLSMNPEDVIGITLVYSVVVTVAVYMVSAYVGLSGLAITVALFISFAAIWASPFIIIATLINKRVNNIENMLPDVLSIVSQNMAAGMTSYNALWTSARPEFGPCAEELQRAAKDTLTGTPLTDALYAMTLRVKSKRLARSIRLIIQGINSGGDLPEVLENISTDMRTEFNLREQMSSETSGQAMFIMFATMVGSPLLLAVSLQFITIFSTLMDKLNIAELTKSMQGQSAMFTLSELAIKPGFFENYAILILFVSSFFASFLVGILRKGEALSGLPNTPVFIPGSIAVFFTVKYVLGKVFSSMIVL